VREGVVKQLACFVDSPLLILFCFAASLPHIDAAIRTHETKQTTTTNMADTAADVVMHAAEDSNVAADASSDSSKKRKREEENEAPDVKIESAAADTNTVAAPAAAAAPPEPAPLLLGRVGRDFISASLRRPDPKTFIADFQRQHGLRGSWGDMD
jgi:hypothetical protein